MEYQEVKLPRGFQLSFQQQFLSPLLGTAPWWFPVTYFWLPPYWIIICQVVGDMVEHLPTPGNRVFTEGTCKLLNLVISDLVDEDCVIHRRSQAISALMFGTAALLSKPGQTLAPLIGTSLLALQTGRDIFQSNSGGHVLTGNELSGEETELIRLGCFYCLVYVPLICSVIQIFCWSRFTLFGPRLEWVKSVRAGASAVLSQV